MLGERRARPLARAPNGAGRSGSNAALRNRGAEKRLCGIGSRGIIVESYAAQKYEVDCSWGIAWLTAVIQLAGQPEPCSVAGTKTRLAREGLLLCGLLPRGGSRPGR